jgi:hypothetical protein
MLYILHRLSPLNLTTTLECKDNYPHFMSKGNKTKNKILAQSQHHYELNSNVT